VNYAIRTAIEYGILQMLYDGKEQGLWEWELPVVAEDINIIPPDISLYEWPNHPISEKRGE